MSSASLDQSASVIGTPSRAIVRRFVWKEYRVLRGLWLAIAVMGLLVDWAIGVLTPPQFDFATLYFLTALAAAVLYAVGAAATTFSVEHEEATYGFLSGLPATWWPVFAGKLAVAATSAAALAGMLAVVGWVICGFDTPGRHDTPAALGLFGVAIVEALAWGTLFSLLTKRPLTAAVLTLVVGATATHLAVNFSSVNTAASLNPASYVDAIPLRLAIVAVVLACSALVARRWLVGGVRPTSGTASRAARLSAWAARVSQRITRLGRGATRGVRRRMIARLLWQTWRESWRRLPIPVVVAAALLFVAALVGFLVTGVDVIGLAVTATLFFSPALYGALAFSGDQRRGGYRFLAEHAARPRYVWMARHIVWLGAVVVVAAAIASVIIASIAGAWHTYAARAVDDFARWGNWGYPTLQQVVFELERGARFAVQAAGLMWWGILAAYGIGQFWSMLMRSEIMVAFVALVLSVVLATWVAVLFVWQLAGWMFLLPLFAGLMLATWLRAPAWITERRTWWAWLWPALAIGATFVLIGLLLPPVRLSQLPIHVQKYVRNPIVADTAIANQLAWYQHGDSPEARETADLYLRAADLFPSWEKYDQLERWDQPDLGYRKEIDVSRGSLIDWLLDSGIDIEKIPAEERETFRAAEQTRAELIRRDFHAAIELATVTSRRPTCRFHFDMRQAQLNPVGTPRTLELESIPDYRSVTGLFQSFVLLVQFPSDPTDIFANALTGLRISAHIRGGQPTAIFIDQLSNERELLARIGGWVFHPDRSDEQLRAAMDSLNEFFRTAYLNPDENLLADHLLIRDALAGDTYPLALAENPDSTPVYLAFLANELGWERERGLRALNLMTLQSIADADQRMRAWARPQPGQPPDLRMRPWLRPLASDDWFDSWFVQQRAAATSYLTRFEYLARVQTYELHRAIGDTETYRRAALVKIALARYRRNHDAYPSSLAELVPEYLDREPLDPYSGQPFQFAPSGLDLSLRRSGYSVVVPGDIPQGTPLFWSVGGGNARLQRQVISRFDGLESAPEQERREVQETLYVLAGEGASAWYYPALVFTLPK